MSRSIIGGPHFENKTQKFRERFGALCLLHKHRNITQVMLNVVVNVYLIKPSFLLAMGTSLNINKNTLFVVNFTVHLTHFGSIFLFIFLVSGGVTSGGKALRG